MLLADESILIINKNKSVLEKILSDTKEIYKKRILELVANQNNFKVFFVDAMPSFKPELLKYIAPIQIFYVLYIVLTVFSLFFSRFTWKGRTYKV